MSRKIERFNGLESVIEWKDQFIGQALRLDSLRGMPKAPGA